MSGDFDDYDRNKIELCCGWCLNCCSRCCVFFYDKYTDWKWTRYGEPDIQVIERDPVDPGTKSIHTAVIDRNAADVVAILKARPASATEVKSGSETALHLACKLGYLEIVESLLENNCPCVTTSIGSPMHCVLQAAKSGYITQDEPIVRTIKLLAARGCDINARDRGLKTALFFCAEQGNYNCMKTLLDLGADLTLEDSNKFSPLYMSVIRGDLLCVNLLLSVLPRQRDVDNEDTSGRTPLIAALLTIVNTLKYEKMPNDIYNLNPSASDEDLALHRHNRVAVVEALLRAGADPNARDSLDRSALVIAFIILELDNIHSTTVTASATDAQRSSGNAPAQQKSVSTECTHKESAYTPLVRLLVLSGATLPQGWEKDHSKSPDWLKQLYEESQRAWLEQKVQKPAFLIHLSRLAIRAHLARVKRLQSIHLLPLPEKLISYVAVKYL